MQESVDKQKAFITNAGHEIKTPLTIIDANTDVIELTSGETEWTKSIRNQIRRLTKLTEELVGLAKLQEIEELPEQQKIDLSALLLEACEQFETVAKTHRKKLDWDLQENLVVFGDEAMLERVLSILLDNAVKYADDGTKISAVLKKKRKICCAGSKELCSLHEKKENIWICLSASIGLTALITPLRAGMESDYPMHRP